MAEYIEREKVIKAAKTNKAVCRCEADIVDVQNIVNCVPTADVCPVTHGYWKPIFDTDADKERGFAIEYECSECGCVSRDCTYSRALDYEFCPYCGAKMDGDKSNGQKDT